MYKKLKVIKNDSDDSLREDQIIHVTPHDLKNVEITPLGMSMDVLCLPDIVNIRMVKEWVIRVDNNSNVLAIPLAY